MTQTVAPHFLELYAAYQAGAQIEYWEPAENRWRVAAAPMWHPQNHYRLRQWKAGTFFQLFNTKEKLLCHMDSISPHGQFLWLADGKPVAEKELPAEVLIQIFPIEWSRKNVG